MAKSIDFLGDILPLKNCLYRTALHITLSDREAEDIVQTTLIRLWKNREKWDEIEKMEAYAFAICRNLSLDYIKQKERQNIPLEELPSRTFPSTDDPLENLSWRDELDQVRLFVDSLPEAWRSAFQLRDVEGLSYKEISAILSMSEEQVKINIFRARKAIRERFLPKD